MKSLNSIAKRLLQINQGIVSVAFVNHKGQILVSKVKVSEGSGSGFSFNDTNQNCAIWSRAAYAMADQCSKMLGTLSAFTSIHEKGKLIVYPVHEMEMILLVLVIPSINCEYIITRIKEVVPESSEKIKRKPIPLVYTKS